MKVLITGGAGYIGSTTARALEVSGHQPVILDSLVTGPRQFVAGRPFYEGDIADRRLIARVFDEHPDIEVTVHMAARIVVPESTAKPVVDYRDNVSGARTFRHPRRAQEAPGGVVILNVGLVVRLDQAGHGGGVSAPG